MEMLRVGGVQGVHVFSDIKQSVARWSCRYSFCVISGTLHARPLGGGSYTVVASNATGVASVQLDIQWVCGQVALGTYDIPAGLRVGESNSGFPAKAFGAYANGTYSISPALPAGMFFNTAIGFINGRPTHTAPMTTYTVTFQTECSSATTSFSMAQPDSRI